ncbi:Ku protein [Streptomyces heliomycini]|uniref:Non-homologous end joining protein Ku n=1 Tax=Streptomyces heliomycini TaxID=284032 RepID=A0ABV5LBZ4_9ACTN
MRSIWNGVISFGLVRVPIKLVNATESHSVPFREIHTEDGGRIRHRKFCELEDREVAAQEISRGYEEADGTIIPITDEDLAHLPIPTARTIEIVTFVPEDSIDPLQLGAAYYLAAGRAPAARPYTLLRETLKRGNRVAIAKFALRGRERLGMLRVVGEAITLHGLLWPDEVRAPEGIAPAADVTLHDKELRLADALMDALSGVGLEDLRDEYREAVEQVVAAKISGEALPEAPEPERGVEVLDLTTALERSVRALRGEPAEPEAERPPRRRTSRPSSKGTGGGKSPSTTERKKTSSAREPATRTSRSGKNTTAKNTTAKNTTAKNTTAKNTTAKNTTAKNTTGSAAEGAAGKTPSKKTPATRTASRKRSA